MRPHVDAALARAARRPAVLVLAASGYGKTEAVRAYTRAIDRPSIVLRLEPDTGNLRDVVGGLADRLSGAVPGIHLAFVAASQRWSEPAPLAAWFREALRAWRGTIVVDDAHHAGPAVADFLDVLVDGSPPARWFIVARHGTMLPVEAWLAAGLAAPAIDGEILRLREDEVAALAEGRGIPPAELRDIERRPAAIALALDLIASRTVPAPFVRAAGNLDALVTAAAAASDAPERDALERSALLGIVDLPLMHALGGAVANALTRVRARLPSAFEGGAGTFELRTTFRETVLAGGISATTIASTAAALESAGRVTEALRLLERHGDEDGVRAVVERHGERFVTEGTPPVVAGLLARVGHRADESPAVTALRAILASHSGHYDTSDVWFERALERAEPPLRARIAYRYALDLLRRGRPDVVDVVEPQLADAALDEETRAVLLAVMGSGLALAGRLPAAAEAIDGALARRDAVTDPGALARLLHQAAWVSLRSQRREAARRFAEEALYLARTAGAHDVAARAYTVLYELAYDADAPATSLAILEDLAHHATLAGDPYLRSLALLGAYDLEAMRGNEDALMTIEAALRWLDAGPSIDGAVVQSLVPGRAMRAAWHGDFGLAYRLVSGSSAAIEGGEQRAVRASEIAVYAALAGETETARAAIAQADDETGDEDGAARAIRVGAMLAIAEVVLGDPEAALRRIAAQDTGEGPVSTQLAAARALAARARGEIGGRELGVALTRLEASFHGGLARLIGAIPVTRLKVAYPVRPRQLSG